MLEDVAVWYDRCSYQAEPYWLEAAGEAEPGPDEDGADTAPKTPASVGERGTHGAHRCFCTVCGLFPPILAVAPL